MISPTGKGIRNDSEGSGEYGSRRGSRLHNGIDYLCEDEQAIVAPFDMKILRISKPKANSELSGIEWEHNKSRGKLWYFLPFDEIIGETVKQGEVIGIAQSVSKYYELPEMADHLHFQINK